jgi:chromate transporter
MMISLFFTFLKIGLLSFGGGYAMLTLIFQEASKLGMTMASFADLNALDGLIPGPIAINSATYIGQLYGGFGAALVATLAVSLPSFVFVPVFMRYENQLTENKLTQAILTSIKAASVGLIFAVAATMMLNLVAQMKTIFSWHQLTIDWSSLTIIIAVFVLNLRYHLNPLVLIVLAGLLGGLLYFL